MSKLTKFKDALRYEGFASTLWRTGNWVYSRNSVFAPQPLSGVFREDVLAVDWTTKRDFSTQHSIGPEVRPKVAWIISPPGPSSGGHQNAFMFMSYLEQAGYELTVYIYAAQKYPKVSIPALRNMLAQNGGYPELEARIELYNPLEGLTGDFDAVVSSDWTTAYPSWRYPKNVPRIYWVLDFEPSFFPAGSDYVVAENSYRLGFHGITIGTWLSQKLRREYGMESDFYEYSVDSSRYIRTNDSRRNEIMFYARPSTPRRATEFGLLVLEELYRRRPDITIHIAGADLSIPQSRFASVSHGAMDVSELPELYNRCAAALVLSMTSVSLLPLEVMSCGVIPVVNDGENTRVTLRNDSRVEFVPLSPALMAEKLIESVDRVDQIEHSRLLAESSSGKSWDEAGSQVVAVFDRLLKRN